jgi:hypothetical protein
MNKKKAISTMLVAFIMVFMLTSLASAVASGVADADAAVDVNRPSQNFGTSTLIRAAASGDACISRSWWSFMKWDLTDVTDKAQIGYARLTLYVELIDTPTGTLPAGVQLSLYEVADADDGWVETGITSGNAPVLGTLIESQSIPAMGQPVIFGNANLLNYLKTQANDTASFGIALTAPVGTSCGELDAIVRFYSRNATVADAQKPYLELRTEAPPNAVTLTDSSAQQANSLPLYAGLGALALVAAIGVGMSRRWIVAR